MVRLKSERWVWFTEIFFKINSFKKVFQLGKGVNDAENISV